MKVSKSPAPKSAPLETQRRHKEGPTPSPAASLSAILGSCYALPWASLRSVLAASRITDTVFSGLLSATAAESVEGQQFRCVADRVSDRAQRQAEMPSHGDGREQATQLTADLPWQRLQRQ
jgi:hypothetical protein